MGRDSIPSSSTPVVINKTLVTNGVEESEVLATQSDLSASIKKMMIKSRTSNPLKFSWISGGPYMTIPADQTYWDDGLDIWGITIYLVGTIDGQVAEIQIWN